jgi:SAM-dependent methyltransferase
MEIAMNEDVAAGHYARKQLFSKSRIVAWSHASRFEMARRLALPHRGGRVLDYGCGDGTFLASVSDTFSELRGADVDARQTADCAARYASLRPSLAFTHTSALDASHDGRYDVVFCMEVLEHCVARDVEHILAELRRLVARGGAVIISVPIEVGPSVVAKQVMRAALGWRRIGDYRHGERYSLGELFTMLFADERSAIERPTYHHAGEPDHPFHGHKGFNWRALRARLGSDFTVAETHFTPLGWTRGFGSSQAWFVCRPRD